MSAIDRQEAARYPISGMGLLGFGLWLGLAFGFLEAGHALAAFLVPGALDWQTATGLPVLWVAPIFYGAVFAGIGLVAALGSVVLPRLSWDILLLAVLAFFGGVLATLMHPVLFSRITAVIIGLGAAATAIRVYRKHRTDWFAGALRSLPVLVALVPLAAGGVWLVTTLRERQATRALPSAPDSAPNVILLVMDTQRADHLSSYGYSRPTSPNLDRLAADSWLFENAMSNSSWTLPSHATMMTGRQLHEHRAGIGSHVFLDHRYPTIAELLRSRGYATGGFIANVFWCGRRTGLERGFIHYEDYFGHLGDAVARTVLGRWITYRASAAFGMQDIPGRKSAADINRNMLHWIDKLGKRPFFVFANYLDVHKPFRPPPPFAGRYSRGKTPPPASREPGVEFGALTGRAHPATPEEIQWDIDAYDESIQYLDSEIGKLYAELERRGLLENTLLIVTSDHGESFGEHGLYHHGNGLYRDQTAIPLLLHWFGHLSPARIPAPAGLDRLAPTIAEAAGLDAAEFPSRSLLSQPDSQIVAMSQLAGRSGLPPVMPISRGWLAALTTERFHYIESESGTSELYAFTGDPGELHDLSGDSAFADTLAGFRIQLHRLMPGSIR